MNYDNILKLTNANGRSAFYLGHNSAYTNVTSRFLNGLIALGGFSEESPEEILRRADLDDMEFVPCNDFEAIAPEEVTLYIDFAKKLASLPTFEVANLDIFLAENDASIVQLDGQRCLDFGDDDPRPLASFPEQFRSLLEKKVASLDEVAALSAYLLEEAGDFGGDFEIEGKILHCDAA